MPLALATVKSLPPHDSPFNGSSAIAGAGESGPLSCELGKQLLNMMISFSPPGSVARREYAHHWSVLVYSVGRYVGASGPRNHDHQSPMSVVEPMSVPRLSGNTAGELAPHP